MNDEEFDKKMKRLGFDESHWDSSFGCFFMLMIVFAMIICGGIAFALRFHS
jgi:hypothetical protein